MTSDYLDYKENLAFEPETKVLEIRDGIGTHDQPIRKVPTWYELAYLWQEENPGADSSEVIKQICKTLETQRNFPDLIAELYYLSIGLTLAGFKESGLEQEELNNATARLYAKRMENLRKSKA